MFLSVSYEHIIEITNGMSNHYSNILYIDLFINNCNFCSSPKMLLLDFFSMKERTQYSVKHGMNDLDFNCIINEENILFFVNGSLN